LTRIVRVGNENYARSYLCTRHTTLLITAIILIIHPNPFWRFASLIADFDSPPNTFTATGKAAATCKPVQSINNEIAQEKIESPAQTPAPVNTAVDASPSTPTMSSLPKTPMTKPLATPNPDEMTPPASTPECPVFSTVKKLPPSQSKVAVSQSKDQELR